MLSPNPRDNYEDDVSRPSGCRHGVPRDSLTNIVHFHRHRPTSPPQLLGSCSMRYNKTGIMVSAISIFEAFELVSSITDFYYVMFAWTLCFVPCFTLVVDIAP
jgi:hypothetical protein